MSASQYSRGFARDNGQISPKSKRESPKLPRAGAEQAARCELQREAQKVLTGQTYIRKRGSAEVEHSYRVCRCHRHPFARSWNPGVDVLHYPDTARYGFGNLVTCGSPWHCPICAPKITEYRRAELMAAAVKAVKDGGELVMMTLTFRHQVSMTLTDSLVPFYKARKRFMESQAFKGAMRDVGALGRIYSTEVTFGQNGWHPHLHILIFCGCRADGLLERLEKLRDYWSRFVMKSGLGQINEHGFDVRNGDFAAQYIASYGKEPATFVWSAAHELTKSHVKQGRNGNVTPFDLLRIGATGEVVSCGHVDIDATRARELYLEFAVRFHGKKQLE